MAGRNGKRSRRKTTAKSAGTKSVPVGALIPQEHGGALRNGGTNRGGTGRPPNEIRATARLLFDERLPILAKIADNENKKDSDRIAAIDKLGGYGLDEPQRILTLASPEVHERLNRQAQFFVERLDADTLAIVRAIIDEVWQ